MEVTSTQTTNTTQETSKVASKQQGEQTQTTLFKTLQEKETSPRDITYEEYKKLTREEIDTLYPKDTKKEQNDEATSLHIKVHMTDDETMNRVLFDKELEALDSVDAEYLKSATNVFNTTFEAWSSFAYSAMAFTTSVAQFHDVAMAQASGAQSSFHSYSMSMEVSIGTIARNLTFDRTMVNNAQNGVSSSERFTASQAIDSLEMISTKYKQIATENQYEQESCFCKAVNAFEIYLENTKIEYEKRSETNEHILYVHTRVMNYTQINYTTAANMVQEDKNTNENQITLEIKQELLEEFAALLKTTPEDSTNKQLERIMKRVDNLVEKYNNKEISEEKLEILIDKFEKKLEKLESLSQKDLSEAEQSYKTKAQELLNSLLVNLQEQLTNENEDKNAS